MKYPNFITPGTFILGMLLTACVILETCTTDGAQDLWIVFCFSLFGWAIAKAVS